MDGRANVHNCVHQETINYIRSRIALELGHTQKKREEGRLAFKSFSVDFAPIWIVRQLHRPLVKSFNTI